MFTGRYPRSLLTLTLVYFAGTGGSGSTSTPPWAPTATRRSPWPGPTTQLLRRRVPRTSLPRHGADQWLLAIPHLIIVFLIAGAILPYWWTDYDWSLASSPSAATHAHLLVVLAGFFLLITRQYPRALFDLLVGINRWLYRVLVYVALMRDEYPAIPSRSGPVRVRRRGI